ncbi:family 10 glycosylhydrolase [Synechococcus sp. ATX 2A4]|uniref:family 10 glycosylhydrolase n=1 Tax=Synechococcus sp. ATX 2A4 TaxID=2823727 RepID=UPI0020CF5B9E|nr:glycoside hydrolase family 10 protein [Synechococcus sp. ATX 2A4]
MPCFRHRWLQRLALALLAVVAMVLPGFALGSFPPPPPPPPPARSFGPSAPPPPPPAAATPGTLAAPAAPSASVGQSRPFSLNRAEIRGVWMTGNDMPVLRDRDRMRLAVEQLARLNFNTIYPVVWNSGFAYYASASVQRRGIQSFTFRGLQGQDVLAELIQAGHAKGLLVIPWFEFGFMAPPGSELARLHPHWLTRKQDGGLTSISAAGEVVWLNPLHPQVQAFILELVQEIISQYDGDGIQFDDHMSLPSDFGYDDVTTAMYRKETKKAPPSNPRDPAWLKWRADKISDFMQQVHDTVHAAKPSAVLSVSPNYYDFAYKLQLQDWLGWIRRGLVDELVVQLYRPDLDSFLPLLAEAALLESRTRIPTAVAIMSGQRQRLVPMELIQAQVNAARERQLGVAFFYFETLWDRAVEPLSERKLAFQQLFTAPAPRNLI